MFSQTTEYALRVMVFLAGLDGRPATIPQIAAATHTPQGYLAKVLLSLSRAKLIHSQRGLHGGSVLLRPADQITIHDVVQAVDPIERITLCPLELPTHGVNLCPLHKRLDQAIGLVEEALRNSTLAEMLTEPTTSKPLGNDHLERARSAAFALDAPDRLKPSDALEVTALTVSAKPAQRGPRKKRGRPASRR